ncbi:MAG: ATP-binding domain-containing protein [Clostridiales bacterium]|jgi:superfamily I DNA and RNA helicase|nr:ATP-binding domain-containing protein [Clostridiales bacterium]
MIEIVNGYTGKPQACQKLKAFFLENTEITGCLYFGYPFVCPVMESANVNVLDCLLISPEKGLVVFNLIEELAVPEDFATKQEETYQVVESRLKGFSKFLKRRKLLFDFSVVTFAPNANELPFEEGYPICNEETLETTLSNLYFSKPELYDEISLALRTIGRQNLASARKSLDQNSKGAQLAELENRSSFSLDLNQIKAVTETVEGVQRIRGLSGSGKTTVLALKAAYLHVCHPEWRIAVTYNTLSGRACLRNTIEFYYRRQTGLTPNWDNLIVCQAWGLENGKDEYAGMYQIFTEINNTTFYEYSRAKTQLGIADPFGEACERGLMDIDFNSAEIFDIIIIDEAQDFSVSFMRMCYAMLHSPKRLVYAYDDMQSLRLQYLPPPEEIFGDGEDGMPLVNLYVGTCSEPNSDIALNGCYGRPPAILSVAHALAFGIYREPMKGEIGIFQMFENIELWSDLGYEVIDGCLDYGKHVVLARTQLLQGNYSGIDDQIVFKSFKSEEEHDAWVFREIRRNLNEDGLRGRDIMVVVPERQLLSTGSRGIRYMLEDNGIKCHLVAIDCEEDAFWNGDSIPISNIFKARSNEAPMVYVIQAQTSYFSKHELTRTRNSIYAAMTRSKAWVRVVGIGEQMDRLAEEYDQIKNKGFLFDFIYPIKRQCYLHPVFREAGDDSFDSDPLSLKRSLANMLELLVLGKIELDEDQYLMLRDWFYFKAKGEYKHEAKIDEGEK